MQHIEATICKSKYLHISEYGSKFNLSFSSYLELGNKVIALDGLKKILLVFKTNQEITKPFIIELSKVSAVTVKKCVSSIGSKQLKEKGIEEFLKSIDLEFKYGRNETIIISFYDCKTDNISDLPKLDKNAKNWQIILSKMVLHGRSV
jgi:hypothetical protein